MDSPVYDILKQLVTFDKNEVQPLYIQVAQQLIHAIQRGYLEKGSKMPGTRALSQLFHIHRNTAVAIYDELASQGWVDIIPNKGTFILVPEDAQTKIKAKGQQLHQAYTYPNTAGFAFQEAFHLAPTAQASTAQYVLNDGSPDLRLHPVHQFSRWYSAAMKRKPLRYARHGNSTLTPTIFSTQLSNYLNATRGFHIRPNNVVNTRSTEMSLYIVSQLVLKPGDVVLVGERSNYKANMIFQQVGANIKTIAVDDEGLQVSAIKKYFVKGSIRAVYVCANRDYPTTVTLSAQRRLELVQLAKTYGFAIIEDDYDYDFQFDGSAMLPMASADVNGNVIYLGKIGQSLFPGFHSGFVVAPDNLITEANNYLQLLDRQGDLIQEQMLSELISEGEMFRLTKKNRVTYKQRRDVLCQCLTDHFEGILRWQTPSGGLAIWLQFKVTISLVKLAEEASKLEVFLPKTILYQDKKICAIRFGFGHLQESEIEIVVKKLKSAYDRVVSPTIL
jgi:GntR family transcriptional regulator/MocR family aminotransferase